MDRSWGLLCFFLPGTGMYTIFKAFTLVDRRKEIQQSCKVKIEMIKNAQREYARTRSLVYRDMLKK